MPPPLPPGGGVGVAKVVGGNVVGVVVVVGAAVVVVGAAVVVVAAAVVVVAAAVVVGEVVVVVRAVVVGAAVVAGADDDVGRAGLGLEVEPPEVEVELDRRPEVVRVGAVEVVVVGTVVVVVVGAVVVVVGPVYSPTKSVTVEFCFTDTPVLGLVEMT